MRTLRQLLNIAYAWLVQNSEEDVDALDRMLSAVHVDDGAPRKRQPSADMMALMAAARLPQDGGR